MAYYLDLFSPETFEAFLKSPRDVSGVRERYHAVAERVKPGDKLICYLTKLSRWVGVLGICCKNHLGGRPGTEMTTQASP